MEFIGMIGAMFIGITLGLIGGGGSILTVPLLVYVLQVNPVHATSYSLFVVGATALAGAFRYYFQGRIDMTAVLLFGLPSIAGVFTARRYIVPAMPEQIFQIQGWVVTKEMFIMLLFAVIMVLAAFFMIRGKAAKPPANGERSPLLKVAITLEGLLVGIFTGIVGAGGGFLIVPALVLLAGIPIHLAIGTSLVIIALKSLIGFSGDIFSGLSMDYTFLFQFTSVTIIGVLAGTYFSGRIAAPRLEKGFGWFVLITAALILWKELF